MSDDQVGWRDEEVVDSLESRADGVMYFADAGLRNYLCTMEKKKHFIQFILMIVPRWEIKCILQK